MSRYMVGWGMKIRKALAPARKEAGEPVKVAV